MEIKLKHGLIFEETVQAVNEGFDVIIHKGGTGSGKTYEIMMFLAFVQAMTLKNEVITIVSESYPHLKIGTIRYLESFINDNGIYDKVECNKTDKTYIFPTGTTIEFFSADRIGKALGARRHTLYGNEINTIKQSIWEELARRSKIIIGDFNPTFQFWLEDWLEYYPKHKIIKSNYMDSVGLPEHEKQRIKLRAEKDSNFKRVHIDCEYGSAEDLVFMPENIILIDEYPKDLRYSLGMDFGWVAPTTLIKVGNTEDSIYIDELLYKSGMTELDFGKDLKIVNKSDRINADSEDQRMINYISRVLGYNIFAAKKPPGSVEFGINFLKGKKIYITKRSMKTINEFRGLMYARDKDNRIIKGKYIGDDHSIDATRYALDLQTKPESTFGGMTF